MLTLIPHAGVWGSALEKIFAFSHQYAAYAGVFGNVHMHASTHMRCMHIDGERQNWLNQHKICLESIQNAKTLLDAIPNPSAEEVAPLTPTPLLCTLHSTLVLYTLPKWTNLFNCSCDFKLTMLIVRCFTGFSVPFTPHFAKPSPHTERTGIIVTNRPLTWYKPEPATLTSGPECDIVFKRQQGYPRVEREGELGKYLTLLISCV